MVADERSDRERALVADDDMTIRLLMREALEQAGFEVDEAENGVQALEAFRKSKPSIVLLDVQMPEMDGFVTCREIRRLPGGAYTPVVMVTGSDDLESVNQAYQAGATDFITKPINWVILGHRVRYIVRSSRTFHELQASEAKNRALLRAIPDVMIRL